MIQTNIVPITKRNQPSLAVTVRQNDHTILAGLIAERRLEAKTLIIDAKSHNRHEALRIDAQSDGRALWLDTQALELSLPFGVTVSHRELPWAVLASTRKGLSPASVIRFVEVVADFVRQGAYQGVLAPTHFLADDPGIWLEQDAQVAQALRVALDQRGLGNVRIVYPLATTMRVLHHMQYRTLIMQTLSRLPVDVVSLRISSFGKNSGPIVLRNLIAAVRELRACNHLMLIERSGLMGHALYAMGLVDTVETGIAAGETYDLSHRIRLGSGRRGGAYQGVFIESLGMTVDVKVAGKLFATNHGKTRFACCDLNCCPQGAKSMLANRRRHSLLAQQRQFDRLAALPPAQRFSYFLDQVYAPLCDSMSRAGAVVESFREAHRRSLSIKEMLTTHLQDARDASVFRSARRPVRPLAQVVRLPIQESTGKPES